MNSAAVDFQASGLVQANGFGKRLAFGGEDACRESIRCVGVFDGDHSLHDDRTVIIFVIHEMHSASTDTRSPLQNGFVNMVPVKTVSTECGDQGGVDVDDSSLEIGRNLNQREEPRADHEIHLSFAAQPKNAVAELRN